jgi:type I restriction enzyme S subunit
VSSYPSINPDDIETLEIEIFDDINIQKSIGDTLSSIDGKIELNNKIITELESMVKTLYDYWFVQFDFPNEKGTPYKSSGGKMVYSKELKREIPVGWKVEIVKNILEKNKKVSAVPSSEYSISGDIPIVDQSNDFIAGFTNNDKYKTVIGEPVIIFGDHTRIFKIINFNFAQGADGTQIIISNEKRMPQYLFYHVLRNLNLQNHGYARHYKFLKEKQIILPNEALSRRFENIVQDVYRQSRSSFRSSAICPFVSGGDRTYCRIFTKTRMIFILTSIAMSLCKTLESISMPCSVNA